MTKAYEAYKKTLGDTAKSFKHAISDETDYLLRIDDVLGELAMIRRVQEEKELVCRDLMVLISEDGWKRMERLIQRSSLKLKRLEEDAQRVRHSVSTLLRTVPLVRWEFSSRRSS